MTNIKNLVDEAKERIKNMSEEEIRELFLKHGYLKKKNETTLEKFKGFEKDDTSLLNESPLERLRFFCSLCLNSQDWLDIEPFFDDVEKELKKDNVIYF